MLEHCEIRAGDCCRVITVLIVHGSQEMILCITQPGAQILGMGESRMCQEQREGARSEMFVVMVYPN